MMLISFVLLDMHRHKSSLVVYCHAASALVKRTCQVHHCMHAFYKYRALAVPLVSLIFFY